jgi:hypothetical protein
MRTIIYTIAILLSVSSCKSIDKMVEKGEYDKALVYAANQLAGEKNKKTKYVKGLETAYYELNQKDFNRIDALLKSSNLEKWESIYDVYTRIEKRQSVVAPLIPLVSKDGYMANLVVKNYTNEKSEAANNTLEAYYNKAKEVLDLAVRNNNKLYARDAYQYFQKLEKFNSNYKDSEMLSYKALDLGIVHVAIDVKNEKSTVFHTVVNDKVGTINLSSLNSTWEKYYFIDKSKTYDKYVVVDFDEVDMGQEKESVNNYEMSALVEDGIEYVYDEKGKVRVDSSGQKITVPRKVITKAWVSEIFRNKDSRATAKVLLYDEAKSLPVQNLPVTVYFNFNDSAIRFTGDRRALNTDLCGRLDDYISDFPSNYDAANVLSNNMVNAIEDAIRRLRIV